MSHPASDSRQFYLGIGGNQTGPFSEQEILDQISRGQIPEDALVWFDGLPDWQPIGTIEYFREALASGASANAFAPPPPPSVPQEDFSLQNNETYSAGDYGYEASSGTEDYGAQADYGGGGAEAYSGMGTAEAPAAAADPVGLMSSQGAMQPVFASAGAGGGAVDKFRKIIVLLVGLGVVSLAGVYFYMEVLGGVSGPQTFQLPATKNAAPSKPRITQEMVRQRQLQQAQAELLLKPNESVQLLQQLIQADSKDAVGKAATETLLEYYKSQRRNSDAARLLMTVGKPLEASQYFLEEPPSYPEAEQALFEAYKQATGPSRQDLLIQNIRINLNKLKSLATATERIRLLEKEFPGAGQEFSYYLKPPSERIEDLYNRLSFYFVQQLLLFIDAEFPQMSLVERPKVSIEREGKNYRIVGRYEGDVELKQDRLRRIKFTFWMEELHWVVVETNLTPERRSWAAGNRRLLAEKTNSETAMLGLLETLFKRQYPEKGLHEVVEDPSAPAARAGN